MNFDGRFGRPLAALVILGVLTTTGAASAQIGIAGARLFEQGVDGFPDDAEAGDMMGGRVVTGDFNGDGRDDLVIAAHGETVVPGAVGAGAVTVMYGSTSGLAPGWSQVVALDSTPHGPGTTGDGLGASLAVGDFDDDDYDDLAIGIPYRDVDAGGGPIVDAGSVLVIYGGPSGLTAVGSQLWRQGAAGVDGVPEFQDYFGSALAATDFNGDGFDDLAIGVRGESVGAIASAGAVNVVHGSPSGLSTGFAPIPDQIWVQGDFGLSLDEPGDFFGFALTAGDFDGDGFGDLAVGAPGEGVGSLTQAGAVTVIYGTGLGLATARARLVHQNQAVPAGADDNEMFGWALVAADFDGDGYDDLAVGSPFEDVVSVSVPQQDAGAVDFVRGSAEGLEPTIAWRMTRAHATHPANPFDYFGRALATGNFDGDRHADLVVGAQGVRLGDQDAAGVAFVFSGRPGDRPIVRIELSQAGETPGVAEAGDNFGAAVAAGDFDGNGFDDLAVGVPGEGAGGAVQAGVVNLFVNRGLFRDGFESGTIERWSNSFAD